MGVVLISSTTLCYDRPSGLTEPWWVTQDYYLGYAMLEEYLQHAHTLDVSYVAVSETLLFIIYELHWNTATSL
jgi:hypothetical protein